MLYDNISHVLPEKQKFITNTHHSFIQQHMSIKQIIPVFNSTYHNHRWVICSEAITTKQNNSFVK